MGWLAGASAPGMALTSPFPHASVAEQTLRGPWNKLEHLAESTGEFQEVVQAFCDTLDAAHSSIRIVRVSPCPVSLAPWRPGLLHHQHLAKSVACLSRLHQGQLTRS